MSSHWSKVKLGSLCSVVTKGTTPTSVGMDFTNQGIPFLRITDIQNGHLTLNNVLYISQETHNSLSRSKIKSGDLLITIAGTIGKTTIVPDGFPECNCNQALAIVRFDESKLFPLFLLHWLSSPEADRQIRGKKVTAIISNLSLGQIKELEIPLPPLHEQKRIAAILDKADQLRQKRQQAIGLADEFLRSVFLDMFGDPVTNPKGWETPELESCLLFLTSGSRGWAKYYSEAGSKFIRIQNVGKNELLLDDMAYVNAPEGAEAIRTKVQYRDVLLSITADLGRSALVTKEVKGGHINQHLALLRVDQNKLNPRYLSAYLSSNGGVKQFELKNKSAVKSGLNFTDIKTLDVLLPPIELQNEYEKSYECVQEFKTKLSSANIDYEELFNSLSQKAFAGEL